MLGVFLLTKKYFFPINYDYPLKFLGLIEYRLLVPISIFGAIIIGILTIIDLSFFQKVGIFITIFIPVTLILNTSFNHETSYIFLYCMFLHKINSKKYITK